MPFVKSLLARQFQKLADITGVEATVFERLLRSVEDHERIDELYELQLVDVVDAIEIKFAVEGQTYKDLCDLAHGQKCTVVLMISLAEGECPLIVDQPEDALHAPWIEDYIVASLRAGRGNRQCLFATRSANVLVSADAEQVIAMKADAHRGVIERMGAIDSYDTRALILYHVEGGTEPFKRRQEKYELAGT